MVDTEVLEFTPDWFNNTKENDGGSYVRHPFGDYRMRIESVEIKASQGAKPHNMIVVTTKTVAVHEGEEEAIGQSIVTRYGTVTSPKFMQQRTKQLLLAVGMNGRFTPQQLVGREFDATVVWEKGDPTTDAQGHERIYVNPRICFERRAGSPKPAKANARAMSSAAIKYLESQGDGDDDGEVDSGPSVPDWEANNSGASTQANGNGHVASAATNGTNQPVAGGGETAPSGWIPESQVPSSAHLYRALIALGSPKAAQAEGALKGRRIDPHGPVVIDHVPEPERSQYVAHLTNASKGGESKAAPADDLPALDEPPAQNTAAAQGTPKKRTGTRASA